MPKYKFISSKFKLIGFIVLTLECLFAITLGLIGFFKEYNFMYLIVSLSFVALALPFLFWLIKTVYIVSVYEDKFVFSTILGKKKALLFCEIDSIYVGTLYREGRVFFLTIDGFEQYKIDVNKQTEKIIREVWTQEIKGLEY